MQILRLRCAADTTRQYPPSHGRVDCFVEPSVSLRRSLRPARSARRPWDCPEPLPHRAYAPPRPVPPAHAPSQVLPRDRAKVTAVRALLGVVPHDADAPMKVNGGYT